METEIKPKRRNISGVYIFSKLEGENTQQPTCFEDCPEENQNRFLNSLEKEALVRLAKHLGKQLVELADYAGVTKE